MDSQLDTTPEEVEHIPLDDVVEEFKLNYSLLRAKRPSNFTDTLVYWLVRGLTWSIMLLTTTVWFAMSSDEAFFEQVYKDLYLERTVRYYLDYHPEKIEFLTGTPSRGKNTEEWQIEFTENVVKMTNSFDDVQIKIKMVLVILFIVVWILDRLCRRLIKRTVYQFKLETLIRKHFGS